MRVRLCRRAGGEGAEGRGLPRRPGELEPGDDHDRPWARRCDLHRADHDRFRRAHHRRRAPRRAAADDGRADRAQHRDGPRAHGRAGAPSRRLDRRRRALDRQGRGPAAVPRGDGPDRPRLAEKPARALARRSARCAPSGRPAGDHPPVLHAGRHRRRHRLQPEGIRGDRIWRPARLADARGADRGIGAGVERVRDGGGARPARQLHHRVLDRERRSDGRSHRRFRDRGAGAHADRQGISAHAQRRDRGAARDRRRYRRLERAVRRQSRGRAARRDRDESARVALVRARLEGDRLSDRQGRGEARGRLHARRAQERDHRHHARLVRADDRLRRHQDAALHLREVSGRGAAAHHFDEVGRRGDGDRALVRRIGAEGAALDGDGPDRLQRDRDTGRACRRQERDPRRAGKAAARPASRHRRGLSPRPHHGRDQCRLQIRSLVPRGDPRHRRGGGGDPRQGRALAALRGDGGVSRAARARQAHGLLRRAHRRARQGRGSRSRALARAARHPSGDEADRYLRRRVSVPHLVHVFLLRGQRRRMRGASVRPRQDRHSGRRAEPDRAGDRVRLLLRPCRLQPQGGRHRDHHGELQSRDRLDRLRHVRPALFRAADRRGRDRAGARGRRQRQGAGRHRAARRADALEARAGARGGPHPDPRHHARCDRPRRGPPPLPGSVAAAGLAPAGERHRHLGRRGRGGNGADRLSRGDPAVLCAGRARHGDRARAGRRSRAT